MRTFDKLAFLLVLLTAAAHAQLVTVAENLVDAGGAALTGSITIENPPFLAPYGNTCTVTAASNATPIQIDCAAVHGFPSGSPAPTVYCTGMIGNTGGNGVWVMTFVDTDSFTLNGSIGNGVWSSGGACNRFIPVGGRTLNYTIPAGGAASLSLYPTSNAVQTVTGAAAGFTYLATYRVGSPQSVYTERWNLTPTPTTTTISAIRTPGTVTPTSTVNLSQLAQTGAAGTREYHMCWNGSVWTACFVDEPVRNVTGTTDTMVDSDRAKLVTYSNASAIAVTLPQAGASTLFVSGWHTAVENRGAGLVTITPTTSTIDGAPSVTLAQHRGLKINSDGTNYFTERGRGAPADLPNTWTQAQDFSGTTAILIRQSTAAPASTDCDAAAERGSIYEQNGDPASVNFTTWICRQTGAASYAWHPVSHAVATGAPATCTAGGIFFDSDDTAGLNWYGCTAANTWTRLGRPTRWASFASGTCTSSATLYITQWPAGACTITTEGVAQELLVNTAGRLANLRVKAGTAGVNGSSGVVTLRVNAAGAGITCTIGTGTTCSNAVNTAAVAAGDRITVQVTTQAAETLANIQVAFEY